MKQLRPSKVKMFIDALWLVFRRDRILRCPTCKLPFSEWFIRPGQGMYCYPCSLEGKVVTAGVYYHARERR